MSLPLAPLSVSPGTSTRINVDNPDTVNAIILHNKSYLDLIIDGIDGAGPRWLVAGTSDIFLTNNNSFKGSISVSAQNTANISSNTVSVMIGTVYYLADPLPNGSWPVSIPTQVVSTLGSAATQVINTTNPSGSTVIETKPSGNPSDSFSMDNNGNIITSGSYRMLANAFIRILSKQSGPFTDIYAEPGNNNLDFDFTHNNAAGTLLKFITSPGFAPIILDIVNGQLQLDTSNSNVSITGNTSGTATIWQPLTGPALKLSFVICNNFRNGDPTNAQLIALPTQFNTGFFFITGDMPGLDFKGSASFRNSSIFTALAASGGTVSSGGASVQGNSIGYCFSQVDTISFEANKPTAKSSMMIMLGL